MNTGEKKMKYTAENLSKQFGVSTRTIQRHANKLFGQETQGITRLFDEAQTAVILESIKETSTSAVEVSAPYSAVIKAKKTMTVREVAEQLGCNPETVKKHIRELFPDVMKNGKTTYLNEAQVTVVLEKMKQAAENYDLSNINQTYNDNIIGTETNQTDEFRLAMLYKQNSALMEEAARLEHKLRIKAEAKCTQLAAENNTLHEWLRVRKVRSCSVPKL